MKSDIEKIAEHYGFEPQIKKLFEEMAELTVAICKYSNFIQRKHDSPSDFVKEEYLKADVVQELADVQNMIWQMQIFLKPCDVASQCEYKIARQIERMEKGE